MSLYTLSGCVQYQQLWIELKLLASRKHRQDNTAAAGEIQCCGVWGLQLIDMATLTHSGTVVVMDVAVM